MEMEIRKKVTPNITDSRWERCLVKCVWLYSCENPLFSSSSSSSEAGGAGTVGLQKLVYLTAMLLLTGASLARTVAGGNDCSDSRPAGREEQEHNTFW